MDERKLLMKLMNYFNSKYIMDIKSAIATYATMPLLSGALIAGYRFYNGEALDKSLIDGLVQSGAVILAETVASATTLGNHSNSPDNLNQIDRFRTLVRITLASGGYAYYKAKTLNARFDANNLMNYMGNNFIISASSNIAGGYAESVIKKTL